MEPTIHRAPQASDRALAVRKMEEAIAAGTGKGLAVMRAVMDHQPHDAIVKAPSLRFADEGGALVMRAGEDGAWSFHNHAFGQLAEIAAPHGAQYLGDLNSGEPWQRELLAHVLQTTMAERQKRHLVRSVGVDGLGVREARGFLSDKYRRVDSRPILEAVLEGSTAFGAVPFDGSGMATRYNVKMIVTDIVEAGGDYLALGLEWGNGDFGGTSTSIREFLLRLWCLNGATAVDYMRQVHLGRTMADGIAFSDRTMQLDTEATVSAVEDVVKSVLSPEGRAATVGRINNAAATRVDGKVPFGPAQRQLTKAELEKATELLDGPDVLNLPPERSVWRASNVLSLMARYEGVSPERREELERLAGSLLKPQDEKKVAAIAA
jgi:hypothetical protein